MVAEALLVIGVILSALAAALCIFIIYRSGRAASSISPILDQRLLAIEGGIGRSDAAIRDEFGRDREEGREAARSLREEVSGLFERLAGSLRASMNDLSTGQQAQLEIFATRLNEARTSATQCGNLGGYSIELFGLERHQFANPIADRLPQLL
jgi:hypothetical protein